MEPYAEVVESYAAFAREATDSPCFVEWSLGVVGDPEVVELISSLPPVKQQPNLVFAAARWHGAPAPGPYAGFREVLTSEWDDVRRTVLARSTQTNEVGRLATLLPAFAQCAPFDRPLALLEVGASAGLNLYPERYSYAWAAEGGVTRLGSGPELTCELRSPAPLPDRLPEVAWRGGIDLSPLDVTDPDAMAWLTNLVWPEQDDRRARLTRAVEVARAGRVGPAGAPRLVTGDLIEELQGLLSHVADEAPDATPVVFHSAVIAYLEPPRREEFDALMRGLLAQGACHWVSNEGPNVLPSVTRTAPPWEGSIPFVLGVDGQAVARAHGHGRTLEWFG